MNIKLCQKKFNGTGSNLYAVSILDLERSSHPDMELWCANNEESLMGQVMEDKSITKDQLDDRSAEINYILIGAWQYGLPNVMW